MNQLIQQEIGTSNLHHLTSNTRPLVPKPVLQFWLSWGDLIIMLLIMLMLRFTLQSIYFNISLTMFHIRTQLLSSQLMIMKWIISLNYTNLNTTAIFWMLISRCFSIDQWQLLPQKNSVSTVLFHKYGRTNVGVTNCTSHFSMFVPIKANLKLDNGNMGNSQGTGIIYVLFLNSTLYIQWDQFITVQATHTIPSNWETLSSMLVFKSLCMNLLNIMILWTLKVFLGGRPTRLRTIRNIFNLILSKQTLKETQILWFQLSVYYTIIIYINSFINKLVMSQLPRYKEW